MRSTPTRTAAELTQHLVDAFAVDRPGDLGTVEEVTADRLVYRRPVTRQNLRPGETVSGPTMMQAADTAAWLLTLAQLPPDIDALTLDLTIHFLRRPHAGDLLADARLLKMGRRASVVAVSITSDGVDDPVAHATVTYAPLLPPGR